MKILYVEDEIAHVELTRRTLEDNAQHKFELVHAETIRDALRLLDTDPGIDLILVDLRLPDGSGMDLLKKVRERPSAPAVVLVTGQGDQEAAVSALKAGAADYLVKQSDYLHRLPVVIANAIAQNQLEREQAALREAEVKYQTLVEQTPAVVFLDSVDDSESTLYISPRVEDLTGYSVEAWMSQTGIWENSIHPEDRERILLLDKKTHETGEPFQEEYRFIRQDGRIIWLKEDSHLIRDENGKPLYWQGILLDITREKDNEAALQRRLNELEVLQAATAAGTESYSEDEIIEKVTKIIGKIYPEVCGILLLSEDGRFLRPHPSYIGADVSQWQSGFPVTEGVTGQAVQLGKIIRLRNVHDVPGYIEIAPNIQSEISVPIRVNQRVIGAINVESYDPDAFNENDEGLLTTIASGLGTALERLRLFKEEQQRSKELETLYQTTKLLTQSLEPQTIAENLISILEQFLGYEYCLVGILDHSKQKLIPLALSRVGKDQGEYQKGLMAYLDGIFQPGRGIIGWVLQQGKPVRSGDVSKDPRYIEILKNIQSELCVPLISRGQTIGVINIETSKKDAYSQKDESILAALASSAAIAFENAKLYESELVRRENAEILREATLALTSAVDLDNLFDVILGSLEKLIPYDSASIELAQQDYYEIVAGRRIPDSLIGRRYPANIDKWGDDLTHRPLILPDVQKDDRFRKFDETSYIHGWLGIPLLTQGKLIGILNLDSRTPDFFTEEHASLAQTFGNQAAIAIEKARLFEEQNRRSKIIETLAEVANEIATTRDVIPALEKISRQTMELLKANNVAIYLLHDKDTLKPVTAHGMYRKEILSHTRKVGEGITGQVFLNGKAEIVNDMTKDARKTIVPGTPEEDSKVDTLMSSPLILRGKPIGVINAWRRRDEGLFNETELNFLVSIANQASICIESGRLFQETKRQAQEAAAIAEVGRDISATLKLDIVLERIATYAKELLHAETCAVYLVDEKTGASLNAIAVIGEDADEIKNDPLTIGIGILGNIARQKTGEFVNDTSKDPRAIIIKGTDEIPLEHIMGVPILFNEQLTGLLAVWRIGEGQEFGLAELEFSSRLAQQAAIAIENARLYESEFGRRKQAEILREVTAALSTTLKIEDLYNTILDSLFQLLPYDSASIFLESGQDEMEIVAARGFREDANIIGTKFFKTAKWRDLALNRKALIMADAQTDPRFEIREISKHIHGWMGVPMISQDSVIGFINLDSRKVNAFSERDATLIQTFANSAAVAIQNARLFASQREQFEREAAILNLVRAAASSLDLSEVLYTILDQLIKLLGADSGSIQLIENDHLRVAAAVGFDPSLFAESGLVPIKNFPLNQQVIHTQEAILIDDVRNDDRYVMVRGLDHIRSFLLIPLVSKGVSIGLITLDNKTPSYFTERDVEISMAIANHASIALANARLYQEALQASERRAVLHRISQDIIRFSQDTEQVYSAIHESASQLMPCDVFVIALQDRPSGEINFVYIVETGHRYQPEKKSMKRGGLTSKVIDLGQSVIWSNPAEIEQNDAEHFGLPIHVQSVIGVPMKTSGRVIGVISAQCYKPNAYGTEEQVLLEMLATHAATAIENSRLYDETQRRITELETINRLSSSLRMAQSLDEMLPILLNEALELVNTHHGSIWLYDHSSNMLKQQIASGAEAKLKQTSLLPYQGIVGHTFTTGKNYISPNLKQDPLLFEENRESIMPGLAGICIPIQSTGGPVGVLMISTDASRQIDERMNLLGILAEITGNAIHRSQLYEQSRRQVRRLTTLRDIDSAIASSFDLRLTLNILMDQTLSHLNVDAVDIALYHPDLQSLTYLIGSGFRTTSPTRPQMRIGEGLAGQVIMRQQTFHVTDLQNAPETRNEALIKREGFVTYIGIPLIVKGQIKGVFEVFHRSSLSPTPDWMDFLHTLAGQAAIAIDNSHLFENLQRSNQELIQAYDTTLEGWARALELRDRETEGHTRRVTELTLRLAKYMGIKESELVNIRRGVLLHDIGKMGVPDNILKKTGPLTELEWGEMRLHPIYAYNLLAPIEYLRDALDIPYCHHEHWDGSGYPRGLKGTQIPLAARIFSIVDIWDALLSDRPYRNAWPREKVIEYLKEISGKQIDPNILEVFLKMIEETEPDE